MLLIFGKGKVGSALARLCDGQGIAYEVRDDSDGLTSFDTYEMIIPSPGVPSHHVIYATGKVVSELDFAWQYLPAGFITIAVTGTDGKSTTSSILYSILQKEYFGKKSVYLSGNFDIPFSETVSQILEKGEKKGLIVIEVSSFMAYSLERFMPDYAVFTNFKPDHLNWHKNLQDYLDSKMHIITRAKKGSVMNAEILEFAKENNLKIQIPKITRIFSQTMGHPPYDNNNESKTNVLKDHTDGENIIISGRKKYKLSETQLSGVHNAMNILASTLVTNMMKICSKHTKECLKSISGLPHRLEKIGEKNGITFIEDSKSTSSQSLDAALGAFGSGKNLLLIAGGSDKGDSFAFLAPKFHSRVKAMVCIGATKDQFIQIAIQQEIPYIATDTLIEGVSFLWERAEKDDVLMLSPGCASFGLFRDYFDRANQFREIIKKISD